MPVFDKREKSRERWIRRVKRGVIWVTFLMVVFGAGITSRRVYHSVYMTPEQLPPPLKPVHFRPPREVLPYSVIPGGVFDSAELMQAMKADPIAREHYGGIRVENLIPVRLRAPMEAQVSYRVGDKVYWTAHKVVIPAGELILTDGVNMIRARCGNLIRRISSSTYAVYERPPEEFTATPEPNSFTLCASGLLLLLIAAAWRRYCARRRPLNVSSGN